MSETISPKDFLTQAEQSYGKGAAWVIKTALALGAAGLLWVAGPAILAFLSLMTAIVGQAIVLGSLVGVVFIAYMFFSNPRIRAMLHDQWDGLIRSIVTSSIIINPIDRLNAYADEYLQGKIDSVHNVQDFIKGKQKAHMDLVEQKTHELDQKREEAAVRSKRSCPDGENWKATQQGVMDHEEFRNLSEEIGQLTQFLARLEKMGKRYDVFVAMLDKCEHAFGLSIRKTRGTVKMATEEFEATQGMVDATQAVSGVVNETDERTKVFNLTLEYVSTQIAGSVAQVESNFDRMRTYLGSADIQSDISEQRLMSELNDMDGKTDAAISRLDESQPTTLQDMASRVAGLHSSNVQSSVGASTPSGDRKYEGIRRKLQLR